ncbi:MAG: hypothetical protein O2960_13020 [Verrucomicrobia bacterium]|nr:hypothetical protein [Verrucomicrobiota bacterium]
MKNDDAFGIQDAGKQKLKATTDMWFKNLRNFAAKSALPDDRRRLLNLI